MGEETRLEGAAVTDWNRLPIDQRAKLVRDSPALRKKAHLHGSATPSEEESTRSPHAQPPGHPEPEPNHQLDDLSSTRGVTKAMKQLIPTIERNLFPGERVNDVAGAYHSGSPGLVVLTDRRLLLLAKRKPPADCPYGDMVAIHQRAGRFMHAVTIASTTERIRFTPIGESKTERIVEHLLEVSGAYRVSTRAELPSPTQENGVPDVTPPIEWDPRALEFSALAAAHGWSFAQDDPYGLGSLPFPWLDENAVCMEVLTGLWEGMGFVAFDAYLSGGVGFSQMGGYRASPPVSCAFTTVETACPPTTIRFAAPSESVRHSLRHLRDTPLKHRFDRFFTVTSEDPAFAEALITEDMAATLLGPDGMGQWLRVNGRFDESAAAFELRDRWILVSSTLLAPAKLRRLLVILKAFRDRIPVELSSRSPLSASNESSDSNDAVALAIASGGRRVSANESNPQARQNNPAIEYVVQEGMPFYKVAHPASGVDLIFPADSAGWQSAWDTVGGSEIGRAKRYKRWVKKARNWFQGD